jgi:hypothetical protein
LNGILRPFELGITDPHPEFGFMDEGTIGVLIEQPLKAPERLFRLTFGEKDFSLSEKNRIFRLRLRKYGALEDEQEKERKGPPPDFFQWRISPARPEPA